MQNGPTPLVSFWLALSLIAVVAAVGVWDCCVLFVMQRTCTVSAVIRWWSREYPIIAVAVGALVGHIFWGPPPGPPPGR